MSAGKAQYQERHGNDLEKTGGPGLLKVQEGHVVILELDGQVSRIAGSGQTLLKLGEKPSMIIPLYGRQRTLKYGT